MAPQVYWIRNRLNSSVVHLAGSLSTSVTKLGIRILLPIPVAEWILRKECIIGFSDFWKVLLISEQSNRPEWRHSLLPFSDSYKEAHLPHHNKPYNRQIHSQCHYPPASPLLKEDTSKLQSRQDSPSRTSSTHYASLRAGSPQLHTGNKQNYDLTLQPSPSIFYPEATGCVIFSSSHAGQGQPEMRLMMTVRLCYPQQSWTSLCSPLEASKWKKGELPSSAAPTVE